MRGLQAHEDEQILLEKQLATKRRQIESLKQRGDRFDEELEIMMKTDVLVRDRLDFREHIDQINELNRSNLERARDSLVYRNRSRSGSGVRGVGSQGFVGGREQGLKILGAIDGNLLNPFRVQQFNQPEKADEDYYA